MSEIHITKDGSNYGPFSIEELNGKLKDGEFDSANKAWIKGMAGWDPLDSKIFADAGVEIPSPEAVSESPPAPLPDEDDESPPAPLPDEEAGGKADPGKPSADQGAGELAKALAGNLLNKASDAVQGIKEKLSNASIHVAQGSEKQGPFSVQQVTEKLDSGEFKLTDKGWMQGMTDWLPLSDGKFLAEGVGVKGTSGTSGAPAKAQVNEKLFLVLSCVFAGLVILSLFFPWYGISSRSAFHRASASAMGWSTGGWGFLTFLSTATAITFLFLPNVNLKKFAPIPMGVAMIFILMPVVWYGGFTTSGPFGSSSRAGSMWGLWVAFTFALFATISMLLPQLLAKSAQSDNSPPTL